MPPLPVLLSLLACSGRDPSIELRPFKSCDALERSIKDQAMEEIRWAHAWGFSGGFSKDYAMTAEDAGGEAAPMVSGEDRDYSDTNTQVSGVDEADLMETDGTTIYTLAGDHLMINLAWPAEDAVELSRVQIEGIPMGIYLLADQRVVVISQLSWQQPAPLSGAVAARIDSEKPTVKVTIVDVADREAPVVSREVYATGTLEDSRVVEDRLYVVSYTSMEPTDLMYEGDKTAALDKVRNSALSDWIPARFDNRRSGDAWTSAEEDVCGCESILTSDRASGTWLVSVQTLDLSAADSDFVGTSVMGSMDAIYANAESLYVVGSEALDGPWQSYDSTIETVVHKFDITDGPANPSYVASGAVAGWVLNQFSMDESDGLFRIVTTSAEDTTQADLYVMEPEGSGLVTIGELTGLGQGETVFAVRFMDDTAFVVTFEQIDPLFTIDLSDPTAPLLRGALEITGFSNYLHPIGEGMLLGIGMEATSDGWWQNVQISMFDVSDLDNPKLASRLQLEGTSWSEAQGDHHAFNYFSSAGKLIVPAASSETGMSDLYVVDALAGQELSLVGKMSQDEVLSKSGQGETGCSDFRRSVAIEDQLYGLSSAGITVAGLDTPEDVVATVVFDGIDPCSDVYYDEMGW